MPAPLPLTSILRQKLRGASMRPIQVSLAGRRCSGNWLHAQPCPGLTILSDAFASRRRRPHRYRHPQPAA
ncbi:hypothetical protein CBM2586_B30225 [Cupriavidus phytorum]|uniref:Uncharacterized protein n=1 Tax=Cupriavidus taiwanensis TaxID=164546 RepID=A0A375CLA1_9BURK|nr:hypothetical protein CBM2586_B30225 [Cupriavidus taiwanensis]